MKELNPELIIQLEALVVKLENGYIPPVATIKAAGSLIKGASLLVKQAKVAAKKEFTGPELKEQTGKLKTADNLLKRLALATKKADRARAK